MPLICAAEVDPILVPSLSWVVHIWKMSQISGLDSANWCMYTLNGYCVPCKNVGCVLSALSLLWYTSCVM